jgi:hypothetical protein
MFQMLRKGRQFLFLSLFFLVTNPVVSHEWGEDRIVIAPKGTYPLSFGTYTLRNGQPGHDGDRKTFEVMTST